VKQDIILAGVGGQGILSIAYVIDNAALESTTPRSKPA
jgi:indolepyruvate ferredoxin oxidoreductase beta subunit